jgi:hypothetical protein
MDIYFSTICRYPTITDQAGELVKLNWESKQVVRKVLIEQKTLKFEDTNPRGNSKGGRGIAVIGNRVIVAGYCELQVYDADLNLLNAITHDQMAGIHEVFLESANRLWVTSTTLNAALLVDIDTGEVLDQIWPQENPAFQARWALTPCCLDKNVDNRLRFISNDVFENKCHLHFNAITKWHGDYYGLFNRFGAIVNLSRDRVLVEDPSIRGAHNLLINEDGIIFVNDTRNQAVYLFDVNGRLIKRINLLPFHDARLKVPWYKVTNPVRRLVSRTGLTSQQIVTVFHVRGLDIRDELIFCGISPAAILCLNWQTGQLVDSFDYTDDIRIAIHGLKLA